ncbi:MAG: metallophosphoesterase, partial [Proteobacteria bacterium]|nr:metallophosphoesterase [Pseudomonadota bacterium]
TQYLHDQQPNIPNGTAGVEWAGAQFDVPVLYVAGNHESYEGEFNAVQRALRSATQGSNVTVLDRTEHVIGNTRFIGCTLWTDFSLASDAERPRVIEQTRRFNPDYRLIGFGDRRFAPEDGMALCLDQKKWLAQKLAEPFGGDTVVITHFAPHTGSIAPAFIAHPANAGFIVPMDDLMGKAALWIHGHTHTAFDYEVNGTRIVCNPRGYPNEETGFNAGHVVDL